MRISSRPGSGRFSATTFFIIVNVVLFFVFLLADSIFGSMGSKFGSDSLVRLFALSPIWFAKGYFWTLLTSMFMHAGVWHLLVNMISLFFIGSFVEKLIGRKRFVWFYIISGIVAGLFYVTFAYLGTLVSHGTSLFGAVDSYAVGASGAIFGLLGLLAVLIPKQKVYLLLGPIIVIIAQVLIGPLVPSPVDSVVSLVANLLVFLMIIGMFSRNKSLSAISLPVRLSFWLAPVIAIVPLVVISFYVDLPIGNTAHFGGLVAGLIYGFYLRTKYSKKVAMLNRMMK